MPYYLHEYLFPAWRLTVIARVLAFYLSTQVMLDLEPRTQGIHSISLSAPPPLKTHFVFYHHSSVFSNALILHSRDLLLRPVYLMLQFTVANRYQYLLVSMGL